MNGNAAERSVPDGWSVKLKEVIVGAGGPVHLVGVGNQMRSDDAFGLEVASELFRFLGGHPSRSVNVHRVSLMPERLLSRLALETGRIVVFDAVEASRQPGDIVCARLDDTKYGFFATHNVPLRLVPGLATREDVYLVGVQPESLEVGEGLTDTVRESARRIVAAVVDAVGGKA